jgi:hypothetical protein
MGTSVSEFLRLLTSEHRVLVLGGLAVIAHGLSRATKDANVWLEPMVDAKTWLAVLENAMRRSSVSLELRCLPGWQVLHGAELSANIEHTGIVRVLGLHVPLDVFRGPNQVEDSDFDAFWETAQPQDDGTRVPAPLDLLMTKEDTGRDCDNADREFLLAKARVAAGASLAGANALEARRILDSFFDHEVCRRGLANPDPEVRALILTELRVLAQEGDPFAREILAVHGIDTGK